MRDSAVALKITTGVIWKLPAEGSSLVILYLILAIPHS